MLEPLDTTEKLPKWKDVKAGDIILIDYRIPHVCLVITNSDDDREIDVISLTEKNVRWSAISQWKKYGSSNKLLRIYKPGDTFVIT